mgnify:CR=1 FL=1
MYKTSSLQKSLPTHIKSPSAALCIASLNRIPKKAIIKKAITKKAAPQKVITKKAAPKRVEKIIEDHHAVAYTGENKDTTTERHMENRKYLTSAGLVL